MKPEPSTPAARRFNGGVSVRMGELAVSNDPDVLLSVIGLGSCVALTIICPEQQVAGIAHVVLPDSQMASGRTAPPGKFADTAVPALVAHMRRKGADVVMMRAVLVGGSAMFGGRSRSRITAVGEQNVEALTTALGIEGIRLVAADVGGSEGRSVHVPVGEGRVLAGTIAGETLEIFPAGYREPPITRFVTA